MPMPNPGVAQLSRQRLPAGGVVGNGEGAGLAVDRHIELVLGGIDAGRDCVNFYHLPRPCLVKRTKCSGNHPGPMKRLTRSSYAAALPAKGGSIRRQPPCSGSPPRAGAPCGTARTYGVWVLQERMSAV